MIIMNEFSFKNNLDIRKKFNKLKLSHDVNCIFHFQF